MALYTIIVIGIHLLLSISLCWTQSNAPTTTTKMAPVTASTNNMPPLPTATYKMPPIPTTTNNMPPLTTTKSNMFFVSQVTTTTKNIPQLTTTPVVKPSVTSSNSLPPMTPPLHCLHCSRAAHLIQDCKYSITCQPDEVCFAQIADIPPYDGVSPGRKHYYSGCVAADRCAEVNTAILSPDGTLERGIPLCGGCCVTPGCSKHLCGLDAPVPLQCSHCSVAAEHKKNCDEIATCKSDEVCYAQVANIPSQDGTSPERKHYYSGCLASDRCANVKNSVLIPDGTVESGIPLCGGCCNGTECNKHLCGLDIPEPVQCRHCPKGAMHKRDCLGMMTCQQGEVCYTQTASSGGPNIHYYSGCISEDRCSEVNDVILQPDGTAEIGLPVCGGCCNGTNCNEHLCGLDIPEHVAVTEQGPVTQKGPLTCSHCTKPGRKGNCGSVTACSDGEVCYSQVTEIVHFSLFGRPEKHFYSGCIQANKCTDVGSTILEPDGTLESRHPLCGGCCNKDECNKSLCSIFKLGA